jgi:hypothetical protein
MNPLASILKNSTKKSKEETQNNIKWNEFSDLYIVATSGNGFTALASKPAASLATKILNNPKQSNIKKQK